jgi:hypothetical protein
MLFAAPKVACCLAINVPFSLAKVSQLPLQQQLHTQYPATHQ